MTGGRRTDGRFTSPYDVRGLPDAARAVALHVRPEAPQTITQAEFDRGRAEVAEYARAPTARQICHRLGGISWPALLHALFEGDVGQLLAVRQGEKDNRGLTADHAATALRIVAARLGVTTLAPDRYAKERDEMLAADRRRHRHGGQLRMPTVGQIETAAGSWSQALELAGLEPRSRNTSRPSAVSYHEAVRRFLTSQGAMPTYRELEEFARTQGFPLPRKPAPHPQVLREVQAEFATDGRWAPATFPPKRSRPPYDFAEADTRQPGEGRRLKRRSREDCLVALVAYLEDLQPGEKATQKRYGVWSAGTGHPSPSSFGRYGGWTVLLGEARSRRRARLEGCQGQED